MRTSRWIGAGIGAAVLAAGIMGAARARSEPAEVPIVLDIPAGVDLTVQGAKLDYNVATRETVVSPSADLRWSNGIRLRAERSRVRFTAADKRGPYRVLVEPLPADR